MDLPIDPAEFKHPPRHIENCLEIPDMRGYRFEHREAAELLVNACVKQGSWDGLRTTAIMEEMRLKSDVSNENNRKMDRYNEAFRTYSGAIALWWLFNVLTLGLYSRFRAKPVEPPPPELMAQGPSIAMMGGGGVMKAYLDFERDGLILIIRGVDGNLIYPLPAFVSLVYGDLPENA